MKTGLRHLSALVLVVAFALFSGAASTPASSTTTCSGSLCVTVEDADGVSPSTTPGQNSVQAYQFYRVTVTNNGSAPTSPGTLTILLTDLVGNSSMNSNAELNAAASPGCVRVSQNPTNKVNCSIPSIPAGGTSSPVTIVYRTSRTPGVTATNAAMTLVLGSTTMSFSEVTSLEINPEESITWSPPGVSVQLGTSPTFDNQFSILQYQTPNTVPGFLSSLDESSGVACAPGVNCFGELVSTDLSGAAGGTFGPSNLFHLTLTYNGGLPQLPAIAFVVSHQFDNGSFEVISRRCKTTPPSPTEPLPCIRVIKDETVIPNRLFVDIWGFQNGGWMTGG